MKIIASAAHTTGKDAVGEINCAAIKLPDLHAYLNF